MVFNYISLDYHHTLQAASGEAAETARKNAMGISGGQINNIDSDGDGRVSVDEMVSALRERRKGPGWRWKQL